MNNSYGGYSGPQETDSFAAGRKQGRAEILAALEDLPDEWRTKDAAFMDGHQRAECADQLQTRMEGLKDG